MAEEAIVVGGGLAGCEAAWQLANAGIAVKLYACVFVRHLALLKLAKVNVVLTSCRKSVGAVIVAYIHYLSVGKLDDRVAIVIDEI